MHAVASVWVIDDDESSRTMLERALRAANMAVDVFDADEPALAALRSKSPDVVVAGRRMFGVPGVEFLRSIHGLRPLLPVVAVTDCGDLHAALSAYEGGAFEYLAKPFDVDQLVALVDRAARTHAAPAAEQSAAPATPPLLGHAQAMQHVFRAIGRLARSSITVLITGESGTGKELIARALHDCSPRAGRPFIAINTAAIPHELLEAELFGHERTAVTSADAVRRGRFEQAQGATLFLDEIGDLPQPLQMRLLCVLAEGEFYRIGGQTPIRADVRVIAATSQPLAERVASGAFRADLFHRLNVIRIELPPLRARTEDIPTLLDHYLTVAAREIGAPRKALSPEALARLVDYEWPGNVRELINLCRRLTVLAPAIEIGGKEVRAELSKAAPRAAPGTEWMRALSEWADANVASGGPAALRRAEPIFERVLMQVALKRSQGKRQDAARLIGWGRNTFTRKLRIHHMDVD
jgi:two-component system, NtrC family, nitrogen regulation response regulator GlnG